MEFYISPSELKMRSCGNGAKRYSIESSEIQEFVSHCEGECPQVPSPTNGVPPSPSSEDEELLCATTFVPVGFGVYLHFWF